MTEWIAQIDLGDGGPPSWLGRVRDGFGIAFHTDTAARFDSPEKAVRVAETWAPSLTGLVTAVPFVEGAVT